MKNVFLFFIGSLFIVSCSGDKSGIVGSSTSNYFTRSAAKARYEGLRAMTNSEIQEYADEYGDEDGSWVWINAQGGANPFIFPLESPNGLIIVGSEWVENFKFYNVHQVQTLDFKKHTIDIPKFPQGIVDANGSEAQRTVYTTERAEQINKETATLLARFIKHFQEEGKKIVVSGSSYGSYVIRELVAQYVTSYGDYIIASDGRLDMPEYVYSTFAQGKYVDFNYDDDEPDDGEYNNFTYDPIYDRNRLILQKVMGEYNLGNPEGEDEDAIIKELTQNLGGQDKLEKLITEKENMARINSGVGKRRFTQIFADYDLSNYYEIFSHVDASVGTFTKEEIQFLKNKDVTSISYYGNHWGPAILTKISQLLAQDTTRNPFEEIYEFSDLEYDGERLGPLYNTEQSLEIARTGRLPQSP